MPAIGFRIRYEGPVPGGLTLRQREFNALLKEAWFEVGKYWHTELRPKHFTKAGAKEYGYEPRRGEESGIGTKDFWRSYTGRKQRKFHHTLPLVCSGELRELSGTARIEASYRRVRVYLSRAAKANWHNPHSRIDMADELTRISDGEIPELIDVHDRAMERLLRGFHKVATVAIGGGQSTPATIGAPA